MKLLTLNTHSLDGCDWEQKLEWFVKGIFEEKPDIIALQEVNQTIAAQVAENVLNPHQAGGTGIYLGTIDKMRTVKPKQEEGEEPAHRLYNSAI